MKASDQVHGLSQLLAQVAAATITPTLDLLDMTLDRAKEAAESFRVPELCGVYFLFKQGELVYIGQSRNLIRRLDGHHAEKGRDFFDSLSFLPVAPELLDIVESWYCLTFKPTFGGAPPIRRMENIEKRIIDAGMRDAMKTYFKARTQSLPDVIA